MKQPSYGVRAVRWLPVLLGAFVLLQCGPVKRDLGRHSSNGGDAGAAGHTATAGGGGATASGGRTGSGGGNPNSAGSNSSSGGQGGDQSAGTGGGANNGQPGAVGSQCSKDGECALANCIDGVCCESSCTGCNACNSTLTGKADGSCAPVVAGQDPHTTCDDVTATNQCGTDGACDGTGACRKVSSSHVCKTAACTGTSFTPAATCDGLGTCKAAVAEDCGASQCAVTGCLKACTAQTDCSASSYCKITSGTSGTCTAKNQNGTVATQTFECSSGVVADGVCCDQACTGCKACSGAPLTAGAVGQCSNVLAGQLAHSACTASGVTCGLDGKCDGTGACRSTPKQGEACTSTNLCLIGTTCSAGACGGGSPKCTGTPPVCKGAAVCAAATGACSFPNANEGMSCNDNSACTTGDKCTTGVCGGTNACTTTSNPSCSPTSKTCVCRIPDSKNLLKNPGFDNGMTDWELGGHTFALKDDFEGCAQSSSAMFLQGTSEGFPQQCVPILASQPYYFGVTYTGGGSPGDSFTLDFYSKPDCTGDYITSASIITIDPGAAPDWVSDMVKATAPNNAQSARFVSNLYLRGMDQAFVGPANHF